MINPTNTTGQLRTTKGEVIAVAFVALIVCAFADLVGLMIISATMEAWNWRFTTTVDRVIYGGLSGLIILVAIPANVGAVLYTWNVFQKYRRGE